MAGVVIITNLGFICMTLGAVCGKAKNLYVTNWIDTHWLVAFAAMPICHCAIVQKYVRIRISLKPILGLAIIAAGTLASYYVNVLWLNIVTLVAVAVARVMIVAVLGRTSSRRYIMGAARTNAKKILCRTRR